MENECKEKLQKRIDYLHMRCEYLGAAIDGSINKYLELKRDPNVPMKERNKFGHYWYNQESKYNRLNEEAGIISKLLKYWNCVMMVSSKTYSKPSI